MAATSGQPAEQRPLAVELLALTFVTGMVDAVSFLALGRVFTANMTGNIVVLGFALAGTPGLSVLRSSAALLAFMLGALIGGRMALRISHAPRRWITAAFSAEAALLLAATIVALGHHVADLGAASKYTIIVFTAVAMGIRTATVRKIAFPDLTTTVLTMAIAGLAADSFLAGGNNPGWQRRLASIVLIAAGAASGAALLKYSLALPLALVAIVVAAVVAYGWRQSHASQSRVAQTGGG
jgi:uncharacterized membrane protein YoaK (UPF0700 family)